MHALLPLAAACKLPTFDISLAWHERVHHDPANTWMRDQIVKSMRPPA